MFAQLNKKALILLSAGAVILLLVILFTYLHFAIPNIIAKKVALGLENTKFGYHELGSIKRRGSTVIIENISMDEDNFNTIESIEARYRFFPLIILGNIDKLTINKPSLTISTNKDIIHQTPKDLIKQIQFDASPAFKIGVIDVIDGSLDILTAEWGGFHFDFDVQIRAVEKDIRAITANLKSNQKQFSTHYQASGEINRKTGWNLDLTMERTRLDLDDIQISRATGSTTISGSEKGYFANGEFNIGGFKIGEFAWSDIAATFEQSDDNFQWVIAGNALGNKDIEFGLNYNQKDALNIYGTMYTKRLADLFQYLNNDKTDEIENSPIGQIEDVFLTYSLPQKTLFADNKSIIFSFKKPDQGIDLKGNLYTSASDLTVRGLMTPLYVGNIKLSDDILLSKAFMSASIGYTTDINNSDNNAFMIKMRDGEINIGALKVTGISSSIAFNPPETLQMNEFSTANFTLPLNKAIEQSGTANFKLKNGLEIKDIIYNIFGGSIQVSNIKINTLPSKLNINGKDIQLAQIMSSIGQNLSASGRMNIKGAINVQNETLIAENLTLAAASSGKIALPKELSQIIFTNDSIDHEMAVEALQNFNYDNYKIVINGDLNGKASLKVDIQGKNPDLLNNRPIVINMTLKDQNLIAFLASLT